MNSKININTTKINLNGIFHCQGHIIQVFTTLVSNRQTEMARPWSNLDLAMNLGRWSSLAGGWHWEWYMEGAAQLWWLMATLILWRIIDGKDAGDNNILPNESSNENRWMIGSPWNKHTLERFYEWKGTIFTVKIISNDQKLVFLDKKFSKTLKYKKKLHNKYQFFWNTETEKW